MENEEVQTVEETTTEEPAAPESTGEETATETETTEVVEIVEVEDPRLFLSTPLNDYTVTEGLLLMILLVIIGSKITGWIKEGFFWLW